MRSAYFITLLFIIAVGCKKSKENLMLVNGSIDGLKKGTLFFQKIQDSVLVNLDSLEIKGDGNFTFEHEIESPEIFYLYLEKADNNDINDRITFFGEKGNITIKTAWNTFDSNAKITGSKSHEEFEKCKSMLSEFSKRELEISQKVISPESQSNLEVLDSLQSLNERNFVRRYRYVLNYGLTNPDSYVTPYIALTEASDANPKYLDSIQNSLSPRVADSKYGKALKKYVASLKKK